MPPPLELVTSAREDAMVAVVFGFVTVERHVQYTYHTLMNRNIYPSRVIRFIRVSRRFFDTC